jgi:hypothetical protein
MIFKNNSISVKLLLSFLFLIGCSCVALADDKASGPNIELISRFHSGRFGGGLAIQKLSSGAYVTTLTIGEVDGKGIPGDPPFDNFLKIFPKEKISMWLLMDKGKIFPFVKTYPGGVSNGGYLNFNLNFEFAPAGIENPIAVVVKFEDQYQVFPILQSHSQSK